MPYNAVQCRTAEVPYNAVQTPAPKPELEQLMEAAPSLLRHRQLQHRDLLVEHEIVDQQPSASGSTALWRGLLQPNGGAAGR
jgi:hypothetical protein